jgi:hypothetical protein
VGDRLHVVADDVSDKATRLGLPGKDADKEREHVAYHLDAIWTVTAVDASGRSTKDHYDVKELLVNGKPMPTGGVDVTRARKEEDATVLVGGIPASKEVRAALKELLTLSVGGPTDDQIFGNTTPQEVGAHWSGNDQLALDDLRAQTGFDAKAITSDVWLEGVTKDDGVDCLDLRALMKLDQLALPDMPENTTLDSSHADISLRATTPLAGSLARISDEITMKMTIKMHVSASGQNVDVKVSLASKHTAHFSPT